MGIFVAKRKEELPLSVFQLWSFDVLLDESMQPWLIEMNINPDTTVHSPVRRYVPPLFLNFLTLVQEMHKAKRAHAPVPVHRLPSAPLVSARIPLVPLVDQMHALTVCGKEVWKQRTKKKEEGRGKEEEEEREKEKNKKKKKKGGGGGAERRTSRLKRMATV